MAINEMYKVTEDDLIRERIEAREKAKHDEATRLKHAIEKGLKEGIEQGIEQGIEKGKVEFLKEVLEKKFGKLPTDLEDNINTCKDFKKIKSVIDNIFTIESINEVYDLIK